MERQVLKYCLHLHHYSIVNTIFFPDIFFIKKKLQENRIKALTVWT